MQYKS